MLIYQRVILKEMSWDSITNNVILGVSENGLVTHHKLQFTVESRDSSLKLWLPYFEQTHK